MTDRTTLNSQPNDSPRGAALLARLSLTEGSGATPSADDVLARLSLTVGRPSRVAAPPAESHELPAPHQARPAVRQPGSARGGAKRHSGRRGKR